MDILTSIFSGGKNGVGGAYNALQKLLQSGIPGLENLFGQGSSLYFPHV